MSTHEPVRDVWASTSDLLSELKTGKVQKFKKYKRIRDLRRPASKAYKSAFLRELIPLLHSCQVPDTFDM